MSYRTFRRVLGETNLERKCRFLFGGCLLVLISGSFWGYGMRTEKLVEDSNRKVGRDFVVASILKYHWQIWENKRGMETLLPQPNSAAEEGSGEERLLHEMIRDMQNQEYGWDVLALKKPPPSTTLPDKWAKPVIEPETEEELQVVLKLKEEYQQHMAELEEESNSKLVENDPQVRQALSRGPLTVTQSIPPRNRLLKMDGQNEYHYYQPVYWTNKESCKLCHGQASLAGAVPAAEAGTFDLGPAFRVIRVRIPFDFTRTDINKNRAILLAAALATVAVAMFAMNFIVRYVIVKPLKHLQDVSDAIGQGNIEMRATINTNDEFEELADAFNRMLRSITDAQKELREVNGSLDSKVDELAQANMQLYEMNRLKSDFLANMSHELRTPLNSILGFSDVLQGVDSLDPKQQRYVGNIQKSGRMLLEMINDILDLAKIESGKMEVRLSQFRIDAVVHAQSDLVRPLTDEKNIDLEVEVASDLPAMYQDQSKVQQILTNLLSNAIKFTPEGGRISVSAICDSPDRLELTVADTGVGIAEEDQEVIFEKFRQGSGIGTDNLTRSYTGTGLGLSIVKELCKLLGGDVSFDSDLGRGSSFFVRLPWTRRDEPRRDSELASKLDDLTKPQRHAFAPRLKSLAEQPSEEESNGDGQSTAAKDPSAVESDR